MKHGEWQGKASLYSLAFRGAETTSDAPTITRPARRHGQTAQTRREAAAAMRRDSFDVNVAEQ